MTLYEGICWKNGDPLMLTDGAVWFVSPPKVMLGNHVIRLVGVGEQQRRIDAGSGSRKAIGGGARCW